MTLLAVAFPDESNDIVINGAIVTHNQGNATGRCVFDKDGGVSVHFRMKNGTFGKTKSTSAQFVAQYWRLATDEEVRRYFNAD